jgi:hypothetical protein
MHGCAAWTCSMNVQHGDMVTHKAWTCSMGMGMQLKNAAWSCSMGMQHEHGHSARTCSIDIVEGRPTFTLQLLYYRSWVSIH